MKNLSLFIFLIYSYSFAAQVELLSLDAEKKSTGDIVTFKVEGELSYEELKSYQNKRVGDILYILEVNTEGAGLFIRGILAEPKKKPATIPQEIVKPPEMKDTFLIKNLNYEPSQTEKLKDFIVYQGPKVELSEESKKALKIIFAFLALVIISFVSKKILYIRREKKKERQRIDELEEKIRGLGNKNEFEKFYQDRKLIAKDIKFEASKLLAFEKELNLIQYKPLWTAEELETIRKAYKKLLDSMERNNGV